MCASSYHFFSSFPILDASASRRRHSPLATPSNYTSGYAEVFDAVPPSSIPNCSPKANTLHHTPHHTPQNRKKADVGNEESKGQTIPPKPPRSSVSSATTTAEGDHSPQQTSPVLISPPPAHQKMFIRASSESSGPDTITLNPYSSSAPDQGSEFAKNAESTILVSTGPSGWDSGHGKVRVDVSPPKEDVSSSPPGRSEMDDSASHGRRVGSASSNTSSEMSVGGSLKKPPKLPKPQLLGPKPKLTTSPKAESASSVTPTPSTEGGAAAHPTPQDSKPPPKPSRGLSQKAKTATPKSTPAATTSKPTPATPSIATATTATPPTSTPKRAPTTPTTTAATAKATTTGRGTVSPAAQKPVVSNGVAKAGQRPTRPSVPINAGGNSNSRPPPKPARASMRLHSESHDESPLPLTLQTKDDSALPPPKPTRRGKSVKIADPLLDGNRSLSRPSSNAESSISENQNYTNTLPHNFKTGRPVSPRPTPKPRNSVGTGLQPQQEKSGVSKKGVGSEEASA